MAQATHDITIGEDDPADLQTRPFENGKEMVKKPITRRSTSSLGGYLEQQYE